tara:strand:- start:46 stop:333 length:288 start_codon:yes stop_codon:yes gene_type:complete
MNKFIRRPELDYEIFKLQRLINILNAKNQYMNENFESQDEDDITGVLDALYTKNLELHFLKRDAGWEYDIKNQTYIKPDDYDNNVMAYDMAQGRI